ncbi:MAG: hypothetical protein K2I10_05695 [Lachnospiraceae bacterium]|nr:hypothetical protein [Lachnospiraceae bacterium]
MKNKKRLKKYPAVILAVLILTGIVFWILWNKKTDWYNAVQVYGPLNIMEMDKDITSNESGTSYEIQAGNDFKLTGELFITEGSVKITYSIDGRLLSEEVYSKGNHTFESDPYSGQEGKLSIICSPTDDVGGTYNLCVFTRKTVFKKIADAIRENFL